MHTSISCSLQARDARSGSASAGTFGPIVRRVEFQRWLTTRPSPMGPIMFFTRQGSRWARQADGRFEMEGVHKRLRQISAHLVFVNVPFFGVNAGGAGAASGPFEPSDGLENLPLLVEGEGGGEPTEAERSFRMGQRKVAVPEPVGVTILGQVVEHGMKGGRSFGDRQRGPLRGAREQEGSVDGGVIRRPLPVSVGVGRGVGRSGHDPIGQGTPPCGIRRAMTAKSSGSLAKPGGADEPAMGPGTIVDLPYPGVGFLPSGINGCSGNSCGADAIWTDPVQCPTAAARSKSDSPKASSWNCALTWFPTKSYPPG